MELAGKAIHYDDQLTDEQLAELHKNYQALWDKLKTLEFTTAKQQLQVLYQEPDNIRNYEAGFYTLQIRYINDTHHFDQFAIIVNNRSTFNDSKDEIVLELSQFDNWAALEKAAMTAASDWCDKIKK